MWGSQPESTLTPAIPFGGSTTQGEAENLHRGQPTKHFPGTKFDNHQIHS